MSTNIQDTISSTTASRWTRFLSNVRDIIEAMDTGTVDFAGAHAETLSRDVAALRAEVTELRASFVNQDPPSDQQ